MSSPGIAAILENAKELDRLRKELEEVFIEIYKIHKKLQSTPEVVEKPGDMSLSRLKMLYTQAKEMSENEATYEFYADYFRSIDRTTGCINAFWNSRTTAEKASSRTTEGSEQKRKRGKADSEVLLRISPSMRSHLESLANLKGEQVAAKITQEKSGKDEWLVVKVIQVDKETRELEVLDEEPCEDEESTVQRKYKLPLSHVIPFPKRSDLPNTPDFPPGRHVLAVYPATSALYKATVVLARKLCFGIRR